MKEVKINLEVLDSTVTKYSESIEEIKKAIQRADQVMEELCASEWKTPASKAFFDKYDMDWKRQFETNLSYLIHLYDCLKLASEKYWEAYQSKI